MNDAPKPKVVHVQRVAREGRTWWQWPPHDVTQPIHDHGTHWPNGDQTSIERAIRMEYTEVGEPDIEIVWPTGSA